MNQVKLEEGSCQLDIKREENGEPEGDEDEPQIPEDEKTNLIVNYLPQQMTDEEFENLFNKFGPMKSCKIVRNRMNGSSYGFGFVDFETHDQAIRAIEKLNGHELDTKRIKVAFARPTGQGIKQANLYVKNVPTGWAEEEIRKVFEPYGKIIQVRVLGNDRGVAFVLYDLRKQAEDALEAINCTKPEGCDKALEVRFANDQKEKKLKSDSNRKRASSASNDSGNNNNNDRSSSRRRYRNRSRDRGGHNNGANNNNMNNDRFGGAGKRQHQQNQRKGNFSQGNNLQQQHQDISGNGFGPVRQVSATRMSRYAPFAPVQQSTIGLNPMLVAQPVAQMAPTQMYAPFPGQQYPQMIPYSQMTTTGQPQIATMQALNPQLAGQNPMAIYANATTALQTAPSHTAPPHVLSQPQLAGYNIAQQQNMFNVASNNMTNAASLQPQIALTSTTSSHMSNSHHSGNNQSGASSDHGEGVTLFVYNIGPDSDENSLRGMFSTYGQVVKCHVVRKSPGGSTKGFGFVTMKNRSQANAAISGLDGSLQNGRSLQVSLKK